MPNKRVAPSFLSRLNKVESRMEEIQRGVISMAAIVARYESALINIAKLGGQCQERGGQRLLHDPFEVADRALTAAGSPLWAQVKELPYLAVEVDDDGVNVKVDKRRLRLYGKGK